MSKYRLLVINTAISGALFGVADLFIQYLTKEVESSKSNAKTLKIYPLKDEKSKIIKDEITNPIQKIDWKRTGSFVITGLVAGPLTHGWYSMLDKHFAIVNFSNVSRKLLLDQLVAAPLFIIYFFIALGYLDDEKIATSINELKEKFLALYLADCVVMPIAQAVNFIFVPPKYRVLYVYSILLAWDSFLVFMKHSTGKGKEITDYINQMFASKKNVRED